MRLLLLFLFQAYFLATILANFNFTETILQSSLSSRPYFYENKPELLYVVNKHVRVRTVSEVTNLENAIMTYEPLVNIGEENFVYVSTNPIRTGAIIYMNVTDTCKKDDDSILCIRTSANPNHEPDFIQSLDVITLDDLGNGTYRGSYTIHKTTSGFITISIYTETFGLRRICYNGPWFSSYVVGSGVDDMLQYEWTNVPNICHGKKENFSMRWKGKLIVGRPGNYRFDINVDSASILYVNWEEILNVSRTHRTSKPIFLPRGKHDLVLDYNEGVGQSRMFFSWIRPGTTLKVPITSSNFASVNSIKTSKNIEVTCKPGYYFHEPSKRCAKCPKGTCKNLKGLQECTPCPVGTYNNYLKSSRILNTDPCPKGEYYDLNEPGGCKPCPKGKYNNEFGQVGVQYCIECPPTTYSDSEGATSCKDCPFGTYPSRADRTHCLDCDPLCQTCSGPTNNQCLSCIGDSEAVVFGVKSCNCPAGSYYSTPDKRCFPCHPFCLSCSGPSSDDCESCNTSISYRVRNTSKSCVYYCEDGYYVDETECIRILYSIIL